MNINTSTHPVIKLKAFAYNHTSEVRTNGTRHKVSLIDISPEGARLKYNRGGGELGLRTGDKLFLDSLIRFNGSTGGENPGIVTWAFDDEFYVTFDDKLGLSVRDLQNGLRNN